MITTSTNNEQLRFLYDDSADKPSFNEETQDMVSIKKMLDHFRLAAPENAVSKILKYSREYD
jgi:hypothetical protein